MSRPRGQGPTRQPGQGRRGGGARREQDAGAGQRDQARQPVTPPSIGHLPHAVAREAQRVGETEPGPQQTDQPDDRRRAPAVRGGVERIVHLLRGRAVQTERVDDARREVVGAGLQESEDGDTEQHEREHCDERAQRHRRRELIATQLRIALLYL